MAGGDGVNKYDTRDKRMKQKVLVDGYNLIYQFPELRKWLEMDLERAREGLLSRLSDYAKEKQVEMVVVFDGDDRNFKEPNTYREISVIFSKFPEKADTVIMQFIDKEKEAKNLLVVSTDNDIKNYAQFSGVNVVSSQQFAFEIGQKSISEMEKKYDYTMDSTEMEDWMKLFRSRQEDRENE